MLSEVPGQEPDGATLAAQGAHCLYKVSAVKQTLHIGVWVAQSIEWPILAQVMISRFMGLSPCWGCHADSLEPASDSVSPSFSAPPLLALCISHSLSLKNNKH